MTKRGKKKRGLQRKVSSVFKDVSFPQRDNDEQAPRKPTPDGLSGISSKSIPRDSLVSKSSVMKKICRSKSSSVKAAKKPKKKVPSKRKTSVRSALQDSPAQELQRSEVKPDKMTPDRTVDFPSELTGLDHLIPHRSSAKKPSRTGISSDKAKLGRALGIPPKLTAPDIPVPPCVFVEKPSQTENVPDEAELDRTVEGPPKEMALDDVILQPPVEEPQQTKDSSDELTPDRTVSIPSWMSPNLLDPQTSPVSGSTRSEDSLSNAETELIGGVFEEIRDEPQDSSEEEHRQDTDALDEVAPSKTGWIPPKLTTPDYPISEDSLTKKPEQAETAKNKTEPDHTDTRDSKTSPAVEAPASRSSLVKKLQQAQSTSWTPVPGRITRAAPISKPAEPQPQQKSDSKKRYGPETPQKDAVPSAQPETMALEEAKAPSLWQQTNNRLFAPKPGVSPARRKVMVISIPILAIILIFVFRQVLSKSPQKTKGAPAKDTAIPIKADPGHEIDWQIPEPLPATMRDPTELSVQSDPEPDEQIQTANTPKIERVHLGSIVYSHDKSSAVVNGRIIHAGDVVSGITVLKINRDSVELEKDGEKWIQKKE